MKTTLALLVALASLAFVAPARARAESFALTDDFVGYMKAVTNPHNFGLRDGRFFPYSTHYGRRIGYARPVADKALYRTGETPAESEAQLRTGLQATAEELTTWLAREFPGQIFPELTRTQQELLVDHAYTEGVPAMNRAFCIAVLQSDWDQLIDRCLYIRGLGNWPDTDRNFAFGRRYIYGETGTPLRPLKKTKS